jgi:hypothetical protein
VRPADTVGGEEMTESERILSTEYSEKFDQLRKNRMVVSFYKYGKVADNYGADKPFSGDKSIDKYLAKFRETRNLEFLLDVANFCMIEFEHPSNADFYFKPTDTNESPGIQGKNGQAWR